MAATVKIQLDKWFKRSDEPVIPEDHEESLGLQVVQLPVDAIKPSPYQTRTEFDEMELRELAQSIKEFGVIQPIVVRNTPGGYELVAGERRVRASRVAGMGEVPAIIVDMTDEKAAAVTLIENVQRTSLNYLEEAEAYQLLISEFGFKQEELARRVGKSQSTIANKLRLLKLDPEIRQALKPEIISERHARALLHLESKAAQMEVIKQIMERELTVKATEELVHKMKSPPTPGEGKSSSTGEDTSWLAARSYINSIKEIVYKAKENGVNIHCLENRQPDGLEILIKIPISPSEGK